MQQGYTLTINALDAAAEVVIAILDGKGVVGREVFRGKVTPGGAGYRRRISGKPGLTAVLESGMCDFCFKAK